MYEIRTMGKILNKDFSFREITFYFSFVGIVEIAIRLFWNPTPLTFLFAVFVVGMYLNMIDKPVNLQKWWFLLVPFLLLTVLFFILLSFGFSPPYTALWIRCHLIAYILITPVFLVPVLIHGQRLHYLGDDRQKIFLLHFVVIFQFAAFLVRITAFFRNTALGEFNLNMLESFSIMSFLFTVVLLNILYLISTRKKVVYDSSSVMIRMERYKPIIIDLFEKKKIYLIPELTLNMLALESKIEKEELMIFFNQYIGSDFQYFVAEYRISHALELINSQGKQYTLDYIATESGYRNRASFTKYFREIMGILPSEYASMIKKNG